jgi:hypothetical protein
VDIVAVTLTSTGLSPHILWDSAIVAAVLAAPLSLRHSLLLMHQSTLPMNYETIIFPITFIHLFSISANFRVEPSIFFEL